MDRSLIPALMAMNLSGYRQRQNYRPVQRYRRQSTRVQILPVVQSRQAPAQNSQPAQNQQRQQRQRRQPKKPNPKPKVRIAYPEGHPFHGLDPKQISDYKRRLCMALDAGNGQTADNALTVTVLPAADPQA